MALGSRETPSSGVRPVNLSPVDSLLYRKVGECSVNLVQLIYFKSSFEEISLFQQATVTTVYLERDQRMANQSQSPALLSTYLTYLNQGSLVLKREIEVQCLGLEYEPQFSLQPKVPHLIIKQEPHMYHVGCTMHHVLCILVVSQPRIELTLPIKVARTSKGSLGQLPGRDISILTSFSIVTQPSSPLAKTHAADTHAYTHVGPLML